MRSSEARSSVTAEDAKTRSCEMRNFQSYDVEKFPSYGERHFLSYELWKFRSLQLRILDANGSPRLPWLRLICVYSRLKSGSETKFLGVFLAFRIRVSVRNEILQRGTSNRFPFFKCLSAFCI